MLNRLFFLSISSIIFFQSIAQTPELLLQAGHQSGIHDIAVSKDGKWIATTGVDKTIILWNFTSGRQIRTFTGHEDYVNAVAFSPNNLEIASTGDDGTVRIWSLSSDKPRIISSPQNERIRTLHYNTRGDKLITSSSKTIKVWDAKNAAVNINIERVIGNNAEFSQGDKSIVANRVEGVFNYLSLFDATTGVITYDIHIPFFAIDKFHVSGDGRYLFLLSNSKSIVLWDLQEKKALWKIENDDYTGDRCSFSFTPDNKYVAYSVKYETFSADDVTNSIKKNVKVFEVLTGNLIAEKTLKGVSAIEFSSDGNYLVAGTNEPRMLIWNYKSDVVEREIKMDNPYVKSASFNFDGTSVYISARPAYMQWDLKTNFVEIFAEGNTPNVAMGVSKSGKYLAFNENDSTSIIETKSNRKIYTFHPNLQTFAEFKLIFTPDEQYLLTSGMDMELWNIDSKNKNAFGEKDGITTALSKDGKWVAKGSNGNTSYINVWDFATRAKKFTIKGISPEDMKFSADSKYLAACELKNNTVYIWELESQKLIKSIKAENIIGNLSFSPDGLYLAGACYNNTIVIWNTSDWTVNTVLKGHTAGVKSVEFSPDGKTMVSAGDDATIRLWDVKKAKILAVLFLTDLNNHIIFNDKNYYTTTKGALQHVAFNIDNKVFPFEQFDTRLNRPDLVLASVAAAPPATVELYHTAYEKRLRKLNISPDNAEGGYHIPSLVINNEKIPFTTSEKIFRLAVTAGDDKYKIDRLNVYVNEVPVYGRNGLSLQSQNKKKIEKTLEIELTKGKNKIQVSAMNEKGAESFFGTFYINYDGPEVKPDLYILAIGVSEYDDKTYTLEYAAKDAKDFISLLSSNKEKYNKIIVMKYLDKEATRENILKAKEVLNKTKPEDYVMAFVAGHGLLDEKLDYYLATSNIEFSNPSLKGLNYDDLEGLFDGIASRNKILLMDACHSGEVDKENVQTSTEKIAYPPGTKGRGFKITYNQKIPSNAYSLMQGLFADLSKGTGAIVISSASGLEFAYESKQYKNGVFTYALLEGLKTLNADFNGDKRINVAELKDYIIKRVGELTNGKQHPTSRKENLEFDFEIW